MKINKKRTTVLLTVGAVLTSMVIVGLVYGRAPEASRAVSDGALSERDLESACGTRLLYGQQFAVVARGALPCDTALRLMEEPCELHPLGKWSCFSGPINYPFVIWFLSKESFEQEFSITAELKRYPCSEARISRSRFEAIPRGFPTQRQLVADDIVRCKVLDRQRLRAARSLLGEPDSRTPRKYMYVTGPERDSFSQVDPELLQVVFAAHGRIRDVRFVQG